MVFFLLPPWPVVADPSTAEMGRFPRVVEEEPVRKRACWKTLLEEEAAGAEEEEDGLGAEEEEAVVVVDFLTGGA